MIFSNKHLKIISAEISCLADHSHAQLMDIMDVIINNNKQMKEDIRHITEQLESINSFLSGMDMGVIQDMCLSIEIIREKLCNMCENKNE